MTYGRSVVVKQVPDNLTGEQSEAFFRELEPVFQGDRPYVVFDLSKVNHLDSAGVALLLGSMEEAMKRNGDVKLAAVSPQVAVILEMTRIARLFEIFENCTDAVESFHRFSAFALRSATRNSEPLAGNAEGFGSQGGRAA